MRRFIAGLMFMMLPLTATGMETSRPLQGIEAMDAVGSVVLTSDAVHLGHLVAVRAEADGSLFCIVKLHDSLQSDTSALVVNGLIRAPDGTLRLAEDAATIGERMKINIAFE